MVMSTTAVAPAEARNERIRELRSGGWSLPAIGREVGLSHARVSQILAEVPTREDLLRTEDRAIAIELRHLHEAIRGHQERIRRLRRRQRIVEEELEEADIKRLLGL